MCTYIYRLVYRLKYRFIYINLNLRQKSQIEFSLINYKNNMFYFCSNNNIILWGKESILLKFFVVNGNDRISPLQTILRKVHCKIHKTVNYFKRNQRNKIVIHTLHGIMETIFK